MRVLAAMSGGVDSAVVASMLAADGHEVIGATLRLYDAPAAAARRGTCCAGRDIHDARRVADRLGIPHYVIDAVDRFRDTVITPFADGYARGDTPVPCIACNTGVKFTDLLGLARSLGCDAMATGHYVRRVDGPDGPELHRPAADGRDQSWFLFATTAAELRDLRFPLGAIADKARVRDEARRLGLAVADKPDSQDICFAPDGDHVGVVGRVRPDALRPGPITDEAGAVLGRHDGIARYTPGQGRRLGTAALDGSGRRQAVRRIEPGSAGEGGRVVVGPREHAGTRTVTLRDTNWLVAMQDAPLACTVQLRAREPGRPARIVVTGPGRARVELDAPAIAAPGQACVAYRGSRVLGGGFIARAEAIAAGATGAVSKDAAA